MTNYVYVIDRGCTWCGECVRECPFGAIRMTREGAHIVPELCTACGRCQLNCASEAIRRIEKSSDEAQ